MTRITAVAFALLVSLSACGSSHSATPAVSPSTPAAVAGIVPGGVPLVAQSGGPPVCTAISESAAFRDLTGLLTTLAVSGLTPATAERLHQTSSSIQQIAGTADGSVKDGLLAVATTIDALAHDGLDAASARKLSTQLDALGSEVQPVCHFALA